MFDDFKQLIIDENGNLKPPKKHTFYATIRIEIESQLELDEAIDEFQSNCLYDFPNTEKCNVILTRWEDTSL